MEADEPSESVLIPIIKKHFHSKSEFSNLDKLVYFNEKLSLVEGE